MGSHIMDNNLTIATKAFSLRFSDQAGSERRDVSRGVNTPTVMTVKHQDYVDSASKKPGTRTVLRFDRHQELSDGSIAPVSAYLVVATPKDVDVTSVEILDALEYIIGTIQEDDSGLDKGSAIFVSKEQ